MKFNRLGLRNFRSFGNNYQELRLGLVGLTALVGKNGSGKTSLAEALEFAVYGKVRGRKKKQTTKSSLANRHNKNLEVRLQFNDGVGLQRCSQPDTFVVEKSGVPALHLLKTAVDGLPAELFANIVSFNSRDFKDFLHLSQHDKDTLVDKLFNVQAFEDLYNYVDKLHNDNLQHLQTVQTAHDKYAHTTERLTEKVKEIQEKKAAASTVEAAKLTQILKDLKPTYEQLQQDLTAISVLKEQFNDRWQKLQVGAAKAQAEVKVINQQLQLYLASQCPTCGAPLDTPNHVSVFESLSLKKHKYEKAIFLGQEALKKLKVEATVQTQTEKDLQTKLNAVLVEVQTTKRQLTEQQTVKNQDSDKDWNSEIIALAQKVSDFKEQLTKAERLQAAHQCLLKVLDVNVNRKELLIDLVPKLNQAVFQYVQHVGLPFFIRFSDDLECSVEQLGEAIDEDSLSEGETAILNTACFLAFMRLANIGKYTNVIFMDEVFEKLDIDNIQTVLGMLRNYAKIENLEIFLVQQRQLQEECFDRIVKVEKTMLFSNIVQQ